MRGSKEGKHEKPIRPEWDVYAPSSISGLCDRGASVDMLLSSLATGTSKCVRNLPLFCFM